MGIIDIIALSSSGVVGVQSTGTDFSGHFKKMTESHPDMCAHWLIAPGTLLLLIGWRKIKGDIKIEHYEPRLKYITSKHLIPNLEHMGRKDLIQPLLDAEERKGTEQWKKKS